MIFPFPGFCVFFDSIYRIYGISSYIIPYLPHDCNPTHATSPNIYEFRQNSCGSVLQGCKRFFVYMRQRAASSFAKHTIRALFCSPPVSCSLRFPMYQHFPTDMVKIFIRLACKTQTVMVYLCYHPYVVKCHGTGIFSQCIILFAAGEK